MTTRQRIQAGARVAGACRRGDSRARGVVRKWLVCVAVAWLAIAVVLPRDASAQGVNAEPWRTIVTPNFRVHYHPGTAELADEVAEMCEAAHTLLAPAFRTKPRDVVDVVLFDPVDAANGSAGVLPRAVMRLQAMPPEATGSLGYYDHWMWNLIVHEYTHILQIGMIGSLGELINTVGGMRVAPAQQLPRWIIEGIATWNESFHTGTGRVNSPYFYSLLRASALDRSIPDPGGLSGSPIAWPQATGWYLYGAFFFDWVIREYGWSATRHFFQSYSRRAVPFGVNAVATRAWGDTVDHLWDRWRDTMYARFDEEDLARGALGVAEDRAVSEERNQTRFVAADRAGERVGWLVQDGVDAPQLVVHTDRRVDRLAVQTSGEFDFVPGRTEVILDQFNTVDLAYSFRDLFRVDYRSGEVERLTYSGRASEPSVSPDGRRVAYVSPRAGGTDLRVLDLETGETRLVAEASPWAQFSRPVFLTEGDAVVASLLEPGRGRDLVRVDLASGRWERLTRTEAWEYHPTLHPDGAQLVYLSDATGLLEPWALDLASGARRRLARLRNGALSPAVALRAGRPALFASLVDSDGFGIHEIRASWESGVPVSDTERFMPRTDPGAAAPLPPSVARSAQRPARPGGSGSLDPATRSGSAAESDRAAADGDDAMTDAEWAREQGDTPALWDGIASADRRYTAARYLEPLQWTPSFASAEGQSLLGLNLFGGDPVGQHAWRALLQWSLDAEAPMGLVEYETTALRWGLSGVVARTAQLRTESWIGASRFQPYWEDRWTASASTSFPFPRYESTHRLSLSAAWQNASALRAPVVRNEPWDLMPRQPEYEPTLSWALSWSWGDAAGGVFAPGPYWGRGLSVTTRLTTPALGGSVDRGEIAWSARRWVPIPWARQHVLAMRLLGGLATRRDGARGLFAVGGPAPQDLVEALSELIPASTFNVRGFAPQLRTGNRYHVAQVEYRMPLLVVDDGISTLPAFVRRMTWAAFVDAGDAWSGRLDLAETLVGAGLELRLEAAVGYILPADFRLGAGRGFGPEGGWAWWFFYGYPF